MTKTGLTLWVAALSLSVALRAQAQGVGRPATAPSPATPVVSSAPVQTAAAPSSGSPTPAAASDPAKAPELTLPDPATTPDKEPAPQLMQDKRAGGVTDRDQAAHGNGASGGETGQKNGALLDIAGLPLARLLEKDHIFSGLGTFKQLLPLSHPLIFF